MEGGPDLVFITVSLAVPGKRSPVGQGGKLAQVRAEVRRKGWVWLAVDRTADGREGGREIPACSLSLWGRKMLMPPEDVGRVRQGRSSSLSLICVLSICWLLKPRD